MTWKSVGPHHISGAIRQVVIDPQNRRRLYAVSANGGIWRLNNVDNYPDASTWQPLTDDLNNLRFRTMALAPSASQVIYAANSVKELLTAPISCSSQIYVSAEQGDSWQQIQGPDVAPGIGVVHRLAVHPANHRILFAATSTGLWRRNRLRVWSNLFSDDCLDVVLDPDDSSIIYLGVRLRGVFKSFTAGADWSTAPILEYDINDNGVLPQRYESIKIALGKRNSDQTEQTPTRRTVAVRFGKRLCVSQTSGDGAWTTTDHVYPSGGNQNRSDTDPIRFYEWCNCVSVDPFDPNHILTGGTSLEGSTDGGGHLETLIRRDHPDEAKRHPHEDEHSVTFDNEIRGLVYVANDGGLFASLDGGNTWPTMNDTERIPGQGFNLGRGLVTSEFRHSALRGGCCLAAIDHTGPIVCNDVDVPGATWRLGNVFGRDDHGWERHMVFACPASADRYYLVLKRGDGVGENGEVLQLDIRRTNGRVSGSNLVSLSDFRLSFPPPSNTIPYIPEHQVYLNYAAGPFAVRFSEADDERLILFATNNLAPGGRTIQSLRLSANGTTVTPEVEAVNLPGRVHAITFAPNNPDRAFAITRVGALFERNFSAPGQFQLVSSLTLPPNDRFVFRLVATHGPSLSLFALSQLAITRFDDATRTWASSFIWNSPDEYLLSLAVDPSNSDRLFLGTTRGVYLSENRGLSFEPYQDGLPHVPITELTFDQDYLYAATLGRGLWVFEPLPPK